jgi:hypothetical protein
VDCGEVAGKVFVSIGTGGSLPFAVEEQPHEGAQSEVVYKVNIQPNLYRLWQK